MEKRAGQIYKTEAKEKKSSRTMIHHLYYSNTCLCYTLHFNHGGHSQILLAFSKLCILEWTLINLWAKFFGGLWIFNGKKEHNPVENSQRLHDFKIDQAETVKTRHDQPHFCSSHKNLLIFIEVHFWCAWKRKFWI